MTFPNTRLTQGLELYKSGAWSDISGDVYSRNRITVRRGRGSESSQSADPAYLSATLDNRSLDYSPRNPSSANYGLIGRNTPARHWVENGEPRLRLLEDEQWTAPDSSGLSITGDIDLRVDARPATWRPSATSYFGMPIKGSSYGVAISQYGWLYFYWYSGTVYHELGSGQPIPGPSVGRKAIRVTLDVNNGGGGHTATYYYSDDGTMDGTWVQFAQATGSGTTSIDNTADTVGLYVSGDCAQTDVFEARVYASISGSSRRASPKFTTQTSGATSFIDAEGNTWSDLGATGAQLDNRHYRFRGEVAEWPQKQDRSGTDLYVPIECNGIKRRLVQGSTPLLSAMRRGVPAIGSNLVGYWPCEDGESATTFEAGISDCPAGRVIGDVDLASFSNFQASDPLPKLDTGRMYFRVPAYSNTGEFQVRFLMHMEVDDLADGTIIARIKTNSSMGWIDWIYVTGGGFTFKTYTNLGVLSYTMSTIYRDVQLNATKGDMRVSLEFNQNGGDVDLNMVFLALGDDTGLAYGETDAGITLGACTSIYFNPDGADFKNTVIGHISVEKTITSVFDSVLALERAYQGERAHTRINRLCGENDVTVRTIGLGEDAEYMGYQSRSSFITLLTECEQTDGGILAEDRLYGSLRYRTRASLCNQFPAVTLDYSTGYLAQFSPIDDDQLTRNKITVSRAGGGSATVEDTTSPLSTYSPPSGVGVYDDSKTLSLYSDGQTEHLAGWAVRLGTVDSSRYPTITVNLAHPDIASDQSLVRELLTVDLGDMIEITNTPDQLPPEDPQLIVIGIQDTIAQFEHSITFVCVPAGPYRTAVYDGHPGTVSRYGNDNTTTDEALDATETGVDIAYSYGPDWTHADGDYDILVDGERMTVTGVSGSGGSQTLTVVRSVNGVVSTHLTGVAVKLADPVSYSPGASLGTGLNSDVDDGSPFFGMDYSLPDVVTEYGSGPNTITSTSFAELPTYPVSTEVRNQHPTATMLCLVCLGAWASTSTGDVRISLYITRAGIGYFGPGAGTGAQLGYGEVPSTASATLQGIFATFNVTLEPSPLPYRFQVYALKSSGAASTGVRYATLRIIPIRYTTI